MLMSCFICFLLVIVFLLIGNLRNSLNTHLQHMIVILDIVESQKNDIKRLKEEIKELKNGRR